MTLPAAYLELLATATGLPVDRLPADRLERLTLAVSCLALAVAASNSHKPTTQKLPAERQDILEELLPVLRDLFGDRPWQVRGFNQEIRYSGRESSLRLKSLLLRIAGGEDDEGATQRVGKFLRACIDGEANGLILRRHPPGKLNEKNGAWYRIDIDPGGK